MHQNKKQNTIEAPQFSYSNQNLETRNIVTMIGLTGVAESVMARGIWKSAQRSFSWIRWRRMHGQLYRIDNTKATWIVLSCVDNVIEGEYFNYLTAVDSVYSFSALTENLKAIGVSDLELRFAPDLSRDTISDNLIVIGGYENNVVSRDLNKNEARRYFLEDNQIIDKERGTVWKVELDQQNRVIKDHCLVTRMKNPLNQRPGPNSATAVLFEGVRHLGTIGGVSEFRPQLIKKVLEKRAMNSLVRCDTLEIVLSFDILYVNDSFSIGEPDVNTISADGETIYESQK